MDRGRSSEATSARPPSRHWLLVALFILIALGAIARAIMPWGVRDYVNRTLDRSPLYSGKIGKVEIHLWRGAYSIEDVSISKTTGDMPVPFYSATRVDFAVQWKALMHGRIVGRVLMEKPELNFVDSGSGESETQTGAGGPWLQMIRDLFPFKINSAIVKKGSVHFRTFKGSNAADVYLSEIDGALDNLGNIRDETNPLVASVHAHGLAMEEAHFELNMTLDPFSYNPTFHLAARIIGLDVTKINDLALTYGKFDFKHGWFDFVLEVDSKEGRLTGYAKPLFRNLQVFSLTKDLATGNPVRIVWQGLVGGVMRVLTNESRHQFGTLIPFTGDISHATSLDVLSALANIFRNAFLQAYLPQLENQTSSQFSSDVLQFGPPEFTESLTVGSSH